MRILLVGVNAKYVQLNLAIRLLRAYASQRCPSVRSGVTEIQVGEWNINQPVSTAVRGIYEATPDIVIFSTYVWNREFVRRACADLRALSPSLTIGLGGPEVSWSAERSLEESPSANFVILGEGERTFAELVDRFSLGLDASGVAGVCWRAGELIVRGAPREVMIELDEIPFPYSDELIDFDPQNRIVYYESTRGCPFRCAYCLSSIERSVRSYSLSRVLEEIDFFLEREFPLVKFVDRTFNLNPERSIAIWRHIRDHYNGKTLFHFEIAGEILTDEELTLLTTMPAGSIQFEIGIQSANAETLRLVGRSAELGKLRENIERIPGAIHTHVDLIAGLPAENLVSFAASFDFAYALDADMLQLGFLKILSGSPMEKIARDSEGYAWSAYPPYEVLRSPELSFADLMALKDVEHLVDGWHNSGLLRNSLRELAARAFPRSAYSLFSALKDHARVFFPDGDLYLPRRPLDSFSCVAGFIQKLDAGAEIRAELLEWLKFDYLLQGKPGYFPPWFRRDYSRDGHNEALEETKIRRPGEPPRLLFARTEYERFSFKTNGPQSVVLFVYSESPGKKTEKKVFFHFVHYNPKQA